MSLDVVMKHLGFIKFGHHEPTEKHTLNPETIVCSTHRRDVRYMFDAVQMAQIRGEGGWASSKPVCENRVSQQCIFGKMSISRSGKKIRSITHDPFGENCMSFTGLWKLK